MLLGDSNKLPQTQIYQSGCCLTSFARRNFQRDPSTVMDSAKADPTPGRLFLWHVFKNPFEAGSTSAVGGYVKDVRVIVARFRAPQQLGSRIRLRPGSFNRKRSAAVQPRLMSKRMRERQNPAQTIGAHCVNRMGKRVWLSIEAARHISDAAGMEGLYMFTHIEHRVIHDSSTLITQCVCCSLMFIQ